jgi:hypothetical protein
MSSVQDADRRIRETTAPVAVEALKTQPTVETTADETAVSPAIGDRRKSSGLNAGRSNSSVPFVATVSTVTIGHYGMADIGNLVDAMDSYQTLNLQGVIPKAVLNEGLRHAQTGSFEAVFNEAVDKTAKAGVVLMQQKAMMAPEEVEAATINAEGIEVALDYADGMMINAQDAVAGGLPEVILLATDGPGAAPPAKAVPKRAITAKGVSREIVDVISQAVAPEAAAGGGKTHKGQKSVHCKNRRDLIMSMAADFMGTGYAAGNADKRKQFEAAVERAALEGIKVSDPAHKDVVAYLKKILATNPRMDKMIVIKDGVLRLMAPKNMFSQYPKASAAIGLYHMITKGKPDHGGLVRDFFMASAKGGGIALNDAKYGDLAKQVLALVKDNPDLFKQAVFVEKDGHVTLALNDEELQDVANVFDFLGSDNLSAAAKQVRSAQNEAVTAIGVSVEASASVSAVMNLLAVLSEAGMAPLPLALATDANPTRAGPRRRHDDLSPVDGGSAPPVDPGQGPAAPGQLAPARTRTMMPSAEPAHETNDDTTRHDLQRAIRQADAALAESRSERQRNAAKRDADIRAEVEKTDRLYQAALDKQQQMKALLEQDIEAAIAAQKPKAPVND